MKATAIATASLWGAATSLRPTLALASAQVLAILLGRLINRPYAEIPLSLLALFVAPFTPVFLVVPLTLGLIYLRNHTVVFSSPVTSSHEVINKLLELTSEGALDPVEISRSLSAELQRLTGSQGVAIIVEGRTLASTGEIDAQAQTYPLRFGNRDIGIVAIAGKPLDARSIALLVEAAARLEAALLFTEVRATASAAERSRMARDMHDGVAQELTSLGYLIDDLLATSPESVRPELRSLRNELTRVISELRLSIFELRSFTSESLNLGAALSEYINQVRSSMPFKIHVNIDEGTDRLGENVEEQLLRIVQEALANARRHSQAKNVWISCQIRAPRALVHVEDDGVGLKEARTDSFGFGIMNERASQIGARVTVGNRLPTGVSVAIEVSD